MYLYRYVRVLVGVYLGFLFSLAGTTHPPAELRYVIEDSDASVVVTSREHEPLVRAAIADSAAYVCVPLCQAHSVRSGYRFLFLFVVC